MPVEDCGMVEVPNRPFRYEGATQRHGLAIELIQARYEHFVIKSSHSILPLSAMLESLKEGREWRYLIQNSDGLHAAINRGHEVFDNSNIYQRYHLLLSSPPPTIE